MKRALVVLASLLALTTACTDRVPEPTAKEQTKAPAAEPAEQPIVVDVYTDLICPYCFIGTERLDQAIAASGLGARVKLRHHAFLLQPDMPAEGVDVSQYLRERTGKEASELFGPVEAMAKESGIALDLSKQRRSYPTTAAHALLRRAEAKGTQRALERALFHAHFIEATNIADPAVLARVAAPHGFSDDQVRRIIADPAELTAVRAEASEGSRRGIRGVPFFLFPGDKIVQGAQSVATLRAQLEEAARREPLSSPLARCAIPSPSFCVTTSASQAASMMAWRWLQACIYRREAEYFLTPLERLVSPPLWPHQTTERAAWVTVIQVWLHEKKDEPLPPRRPEPTGRPLRPMWSYRIDSIGRSV